MTAAFDRPPLRDGDESAAAA
eukprot:COSAG02_NODE_28217_length_593_cov_2.350202_1_plen_20_part_01